MVSGFRMKASGCRVYGLGGYKYCMTIAGVCFSHKPHTTARTAHKLATSLSPPHPRYVQPLPQASGRATRAQCPRKRGGPRFRRRRRRSCLSLRPAPSAGSSSLRRIPRTRRRRMSVCPVGVSASWITSLVRVKMVGLP